MYRIAIRHYESDKKYNSDHNLKDDAQILKIVILDEKYQTLLTDIVVGNVISEDDISENFVSAANILLTLRYPYQLIKSKMMNDLELISLSGNEYFNLTAEYKRILGNRSPSTVEIKQLKAKLDLHIEDLKSLRDRF